MTIIRNNDRRLQLLYLDPITDNATIKAPTLSHVQVENLLRRALTRLDFGGGDLRSMSWQGPKADVLIFEDSYDQTLQISGIAPHAEFLQAICMRALDGVTRHLLAEAVYARLVMAAPSEPGIIA